MTNPLMDPSSLPAFSQIRPEHVQPAVEAALKHCRDTVEQVLAGAGPVTWDSLVAPVDEAEDKLSRIWSPVSHMNSVVSNEALREAHDACLPLLSEYSTWLGQNKALYEAYKALAASDEFANLSPAQKKVVENGLRDFELSGIGLPEAEQKRYGEIVMRLSELSSRYSNQLLDATNAWSKLITDVSELAGLPESALEAAQQSAALREQEGYLLTLEFPSYLAVMTYADNAELRREVYTAFCTRASEQGPHAGQFDNGPLMDELLALRQELSQLLGFESPAHKSLATKMAETPEQVISFLNELALASRGQGEEELKALTAYARAEHGVESLNAWDITYYAEKQKQHLYQISDEALRPYFPEDKVLSGLFHTLERLFSVKVQERKDIDTWHKDVRFFDLLEADGSVRGSFYLDLYARQNKRGGAWMDDCQGRRYRADGSLQKPVAYLTCNFNGPVGDKPALFTHDEVVTLFHEFGHGIHHMLTRIEDAPGVAGINGVPWDAVELPSQFLENWCWEAEALGEISGHYETGEPLPVEMLDKMLAAKNYQSAMMMLRQLEFALFDFRLHLECAQLQGDNPIQSILDEVREQVAVIKAPEFNRFQHGFSHIFAGGYAAGYYSYKWAEVLSADAFSRFEEEGIFNPLVGADFLHHILEMGGSEEPMALFTRFRGREPEIDALLRHSGIAQ
ncbi:oligopeptidase A [Ferrimonas balearica]|uniref:oligopeptidase A n=1 Tax=Ferrimonas balearica TaxID=44012 RepID=UPI001C998E37|nr:oligopeptidase A [Ferrimonas balearica]MBY5923261.1 oligopeptidase A [Ferrimonas balearica]MBY5995219.1 oligopeptidase A [Ferrimonas balearica]